MTDINDIICGNATEVMRDIDSESIDCIITSPPYWGLRDYGSEGQIGLEPTLEEYHNKLLNITAECTRVLKATGTMFWVHGNSYSDKTLTMQNYRLSIRMVDEQGWILRNVLIWHKKNNMPSSVQDRFTNAYEPVFFYTKSSKYFFNLEAIRIPQKEESKKRIVLAKRQKKCNSIKNKEMHKFNNTYRTTKDICENLDPEKGKNPGDVSTLSVQPFFGAHFAVFPETLIEPFIKAGCPKGGIVLDPFMGAGTTAVMAKKQGRLYRGIEINQEYIQIAKRRISNIPVRLDRFM